MRPKFILIISGILVLTGMLISFLQSENEVNDLATVQQDLPQGSFMNVSKSLDPVESKNGVYSIQISDAKEGDSLSATITDPNGNIVTSKSITKSLFQENFTIFSQGTYELKIQNTAQSDMQVLAIIGYYPHGTTLLDVFDIIVLIAGLGGLAVGIMYLVKERRGKANLS